MIDINTPDAGKSFYAFVNEDKGYQVDLIFEDVSGKTYENDGVILLSTYDTSLRFVKAWDYQNSTWDNPTFIDTPFRYLAQYSTDVINVGTGDVCLTDAINQKAVAGSYVGNGMTTRTIELGFTPSAVLVMREDGLTKDDTAIVGGLAVTGSPVVSSADLYALQIVENGFMVARNAGVNTNMSVTTYNYVAFK